MTGKETFTKTDENGDVIDFLEGFEPPPKVPDTDSINSIRKVLIQKAETVVKKTDKPQDWQLDKLQQYYRRIKEYFPPI